ncbi:hypothetical protein [Methylococcus geothermalis]|uniref:Uncharacterized protein n=1 Tax=Methylococcus geothermalis TaxID=2681310 RepID=A0A858Q750_9GAMM|nr:hypothetical protein [Methylococcus geothermalis]QJD29651.1 hypothetical protein GNH96_06510 [Methylococcus geothermalis]
MTHRYAFFCRTAAALLGLSVAAGPAFGASSPRDMNNARQMYQGASMNCLVANDFYAVHFTAMQEGRYEGERHDFVKYCQEIPGTGKTYLSIDLLDRDVRNTPVALRVIEEDLGEGGQLPKEKSTLSEVPPKIYKNGTVETYANITRPGHYALIAVIGDEAVTEDDRLRIPFSVGVPSPVQPNRWPGALAALVGAIVLATLCYVAYRHLGLRRAGSAAAGGTAKAPRRFPV